MLSLLAFLLGFILDLLFGDPHWLPHPIRLIGFMIAKLERFLRWILPKGKYGELAGGGLLVILVSGLSFFVSILILIICTRIHPLLAFFVEAIMCYQILAVNSLKKESMKVYTELKKGDLPAARKAVSMIVGRDTQILDEKQVAKAAVETVAENTSDGVAAPLLFLALGGAPLGFLYKAINTMDSMVGYKNEQYLFFGRAAAKLDDYLNFIPARFCSWVMIASSKLLNLNTKNAIRVYRRDKKNHSSPNSAHTESVCAGALDILLAGDSYYFGKLVKKQTIGDDIRPIVPEDIKRANQLMYTTAVLFFCLCFLLRFLLLR